MDLNIKNDKDKMMKVSKNVTTIVKSEVEYEYSMEDILALIRADIVSKHKCDIGKLNKDFKVIAKGDDGNCNVFESYSGFDFNTFNIQVETTTVTEGKV